MTTGASTRPFARDRRPLPQAVVRGQVRLQPRSHKLLAFRLLQAHPQKLPLLAHGMGRKTRREPRMTTRTSTSPFARDRLAQAVARRGVRLWPRGLLADKLLACRLLQAHPQQLRDAGGARKGRGVWTRWKQNIRGGEKVGHRRQVRRSYNRWRIRWPACGEKHRIYAGRIGLTASDLRAQRRCCISCGARLVPALAEGEPWRKTG